MVDVFQPVPPSLRRERLEAYAAFLAERDGEPDFERRSLPRREEQAARFETPALRYDGPFDASLFQAQYRRHDPARPTPPEVLLLLTLVKTNANEAYAVEQMLRMPVRSDPLEGRLERLVYLEEFYHTRLLLSSSALFGVRVTATVPPSPFIRHVITGITKLPEAASRPLALAGEIVGIITFLRMIGAVRRVFRDHPELRDALEERVLEVVIDEIGHMSLNRLLGRPSTFAALRPMLAAVALGTRGAMPEAEALGILPVPVREALTFDVSALPEEARRKGFLA